MKHYINYILIGILFFIKSLNTYGQIKSNVDITFGKFMISMDSIRDNDNFISNNSFKISTKNGSIYGSIAELIEFIPKDSLRNYYLNYIKKVNNNHNVKAKDITFFKIGNTEGVYFKVPFNREIRRDTKHFLLIIIDKEEYTFNFSDPGPLNTKDNLSKEDVINSMRLLK